MKIFKRSEKTRRLISLANKRRFANPENHPLYGKKHSAEAKKRMSESHKIFYASGHQHPMLGKKHSEEAKAKMSIAHKKLIGPKASQWGGGHYQEGKRGYIFINTPYHPFCDCRGYALEHRLVIEKMICRFLHPREPVHHINKNKSDNRPENLIAFISQAAHNSFESGKVIHGHEIIFDGRKINHHKLPDSEPHEASATRKRKLQLNSNK